MRGLPEVLPGLAGLYRSTLHRRLLMLAASLGLAWLARRTMADWFEPVIGNPWETLGTGLRLAVVASGALGIFGLARLGGLGLADARQLHRPSPARSSLDTVRWFRFLNPVGLVYSLGVHRHLLRQLIARDVAVRYKGSFLGIVWSMVTPLLMLAIYTFVFSVVFHPRWGGAAETSRVDFAVTLFAGLIAFNAFSESANRATTLIGSNPNYVKRVIFPLEMLPVSVVGSALFHAAVSSVILAAGLLATRGSLPWSFLLLPVAAVPLAALALGFGWLLASLGVYVRDTAYLVSLGTQMLFFLTPLFYPLDAVPAGFRAAMWLNPLTAIVDGIRRVTLWGQPPAWGMWLGVTAVSGLLCLLGFAWFMKTKAGFADVL